MFTFRVISDPEITLVDIFGCAVDTEIDISPCVLTLVLSTQTGSVLRTCPLHRPDRD